MVFAIVIWVAGLCFYKAPVWASIPASDYQPDDRYFAAWQTDFDEAIGRAQVSLQPLLVFFTRPDCLDCHRLKTGALAKETLQPVLKRFACVKIDLSTRPELLMLFQIKSLPTLMVISPDGRILSRFTGYHPASQLEKALTLILAGKEDFKEVDLLIDSIKTGHASRQVWQKALQLMGDNEARQKIQAISENLSDQDKQTLVACLKDHLLCVRLGALELLEDISGHTSFFDPWSDLQARACMDAFEQWQAWAGSGKPMLPDPDTFTRKRFERYLQDLIKQDSDKSDHAAQRTRYALHMLLRGGQKVKGWLEDYLATKPILDENALRRIKEVQYGLIIPSNRILNPATAAHRLIWGHQDVKPRTIQQLVDCGSQVFPVFVDLLDSKQSVIREATVEAMFQTGRQNAVEPIRLHLKQESDPDIIFVILKHLSDIKSRASLEILESYCQNENEDLAIAAIYGTTKLSIGPVAVKMLPLLQDPRWRVRVAALEAIQQKGGEDSDLIGQIRGKKVDVAHDVSLAVIKCLDDPDEFVRHTAAVTVGQLTIFKAKDALKKAYRKYPEMRGIVISVLLELNSSIPGSYVDDLFGPDPNDLLFVLDHMEKVYSKNRDLIHRAAQSNNMDVSCTALRIIAGTENRNSRDNAILVSAVKNGSNEQRLTVIQDFDVDSDQQKTLLAALGKEVSFSRHQHSDVKDANLGVLYAISELADNETVSGLVKSEALILLCRYGHSLAFKRISEQWQDLTPSRRVAVIDCLADYSTDAIPVFKQALADDNQSVWQSAAYHMASSNQIPLVQTLSEYLLGPACRLRPAMVWPLGMKSFCSKFPQAMMPFARQILANPSQNRPDMVIYALTIFAKAGGIGVDQGPVVTLTKDDNPFIRRSAWIALSSQGSAKLMANINPITKDPSKYVREIVPAFLYNHTYSIKLDLYFSEDEFLVGDDGLSLEVTDYSARQSAMADKKKIKEILETIIENDSDMLIRYQSMLALLSNYIAYDLNKVAATARQCNNPHAVARMTKNLFSDYGSSLGKNFKLLLPLLQIPDNQDYGEYYAREFRKRWNINTSSSGQDQPLSAMATFDAPDHYGSRQQNFTVFDLHVFVTSSWKGLESIGWQISGLRYNYPNLHVIWYDIQSQKGMQVNEILCTKFNVDSKNRARVPAVFMKNGYLIGDELNSMTLEELAQRSANETIASAFPKLGLKEQNEALSSIKKRAASYSWFSFASNGFSDGLTIGIFTAVVFLLSYLFKANQKGLDIYKTGCIYASVMIAAGFLRILGFGQMMLLSDKGSYIMGIFQASLALLMFCFAIGSFFGMLRCMRKPGKNKPKKRVKRIFKPRKTRVVTVAVWWAMLVSILNVVRVGDAQTVTMTYLIMNQALLIKSLLTLGLYYLLFITPQTSLFLACAMITDTDRFQVLASNHRAFFKFLLSLLWGGLFFYYVEYIWL